MAASLDDLHERKQHQLEDHQKKYVYGIPALPTAFWAMFYGGRMYDNWVNATAGDSPEGTHPSWPTTNTQHSGESTWRCKACHSWDYKGVGDMYATGPIPQA